jgi:hypothetical protein
MASESVVKKTSHSGPPVRGYEEHDVEKSADQTQCPSPASTAYNVATCIRPITGTASDTSVCALDEHSQFTASYKSASQSRSTSDRLHYRQAKAGITSASYQEGQISSLDKPVSGLPEPKVTAEELLQNIPVEVHEHLMFCFWTYYNPVWHPISSEAFFLDKENGASEFYSTLLHLCILAIGCRLADQSRSEVRDYVRCNKSLLQREAKATVEKEIVAKTSISLMISTLLMSDLEGHTGRYNAGWFFSGKFFGSCKIFTQLNNIGVAARMCIALGLHNDLHGEKLINLRSTARRLAFFSCISYDRYYTAITLWTLLISVTGLGHYSWDVRQRFNLLLQRP